MYLQSNYLHWWAYVQLIWNGGNSEVITTSGAWYSFSISKLFLEMSYISHGFFADIKKLYWWHFLLTKSKHWFIIKYLIDQGTLQTPFCCVFHCTTDLITGICHDWWQKSSFINQPSWFAFNTQNLCQECCCQKCSRENCWELPAALWYIANRWSLQYSLLQWF